MDGFTAPFVEQMVEPAFGDAPLALSESLAQRTLRHPISCRGVGLHTGRVITMELLPAAEDTGIVFRRTDLGIDLPARFDHVTDTRLCTQLADPADPDVRVGTIEHVMAALAASGIDNAIVAVDGPEIPVLDGSAEPFMFLVDCAGQDVQAAPRHAIEIMRTVRVTDGEAFAELRPNPGIAAFDLSLSIAFDAPAIGRQALSLRLTRDAFRAELARARTFVLADEIESLHEAGLARGGSLDNAVVVDGARVLNPSGLRYPDEFVRHKLLDVVGDLALAGAPLRGRFVGHRTGHALNNRLMRTLFADPLAWRLVTPDWAGFAVAA